MSLLDLITSQLGDDGVGRLGNAIGANPQQTGAAMSAALPLLMGAMSRNAQNAEGAESLQRALERDHDGSILEDVGGFLNRGDTSPGDGILKHVLGNRQQRVAQGLSQASGLDPAAAGKLLPMLAPLVMGALGKQQRTTGGGASALAGLLSAEASRGQQAAPAAQGLARLLDADGDGDITDDVARVGKGLLGKLFGR